MSGISGANELAKVLRKLPRRVGQDVLSRSLRVGANVIRKEAKLQAPMADAVYLGNKHQMRKKRRYGHLRENIKVTATKHKSGAAQMTVHTGRAYWGMFLEFGTRYIAAHPWLSVAFEAKHGEALEKIGERLGQNIEKAAAMLAGPRSKMTKAFKKRL
jgi:HK97 gp10 family phage protein